MNSGRLEACSDGVIAIIITIMVLDFKVPNGSDFETLKPLVFKFMSDVMSFIYVASLLIYFSKKVLVFKKRCVGIKMEIQFSCCTSFNSIMSFFVNSFILFIF